MKIRVNTKFTIIKLAIEEKCTIGVIVKVYLDRIVFNHVVSIETPQTIRDYLLGISVEPFDFNIEIPPEFVRLPFEQIPCVIDELRAFINP